MGRTNEGWREHRERELGWRYSFRACSIGRRIRKDESRPIFFGLDLERALHFSRLKDLETVGDLVNILRAIPIPFNPPSTPLTHWGISTVD